MREQVIKEILERKIIAIVRGATETEAVKYIDNLPEDIDLGGYEVRVFTQSSSFVVEPDETADIINDQI